MKFELPQLPYAYDALEPAIDAQTMELHHSKHHAGYVSKLNTLLEEHQVAPLSLEELLQHISTYPVGIRNNAGGHYNHSLYWECLSPEGVELSEDMIATLSEHFGSVEKCKEEFIQTALGQFGSGWAWLVLTQEGKLRIFSTANQDNPLMDVVQEQEGVCTPLLGIDVWEHAYYLQYQNRRADYLEKIWDNINWNFVEERLKLG